MKQIDNAWPSIGILPMGLTPLSCASSLAPHLRGVPTSPWPTVTSLTSDSVSSSDAGCTLKSTRHGLLARLSVPILSKCLTPLRHSGQQRSLLSAKALSLPVFTAMVWLQSMATNLSHCMAKRLPTLGLHMPPPKNWSRPRVQLPRQCRGD